jgi:hypothetical protein
VVCDIIFKGLGIPAYDNETGNWRILISKEIYAVVKKIHYNRDNKII